MNLTDTAAPDAELWTVTETKRRLAAAAKIAREFSSEGLGDNYRVEVGLRRLPVAYRYRPTAREVWAREADGDDLADFISPRDIKAADRDSEHYRQIFQPGAVVHLYFTSPGAFGELIDIVTVWLGHDGAEPEVVGTEADRRLADAEEKTTPEATRFYGADLLGFYDDDPHREEAADYASVLIAEARHTGELYGETIPSPADAASAIGDLVKSEYPKSGATDTVCREAFYLGLIGELDAQLEAGEVDPGREPVGASDDLDDSDVSARPGVALVEGKPGWGIYREPTGLVSQFWVNLGRAFYGPFGSFEVARDELTAEVEAPTKRRYEDQPDEIDLPTFEGGYGFRSGRVRAGDAVALTRRPDGSGLVRPEPLFGYVRHVDTEEDVATIVDVERGPITVFVGDVETVAVLPGREDRGHRPCGSNCQIHCQPKGRS